MKTIGSISIIILISFLLINLFCGIKTTRKPEINHEELVEFVSSELNYEILYGDGSIDNNAFVDTVLKKKLKSLNNR